MTTTLRVIVDDLTSSGSAESARYTEELTRGLLATVPAGCEVVGIVASATESDHRTIETLLPGLALRKSPLARRELQLAWQHGITTLPGTGMVHAPSPLAPLSRHDRTTDPAHQTVVTFHDAAAWSHPDLLSSREVSWTRAMAKRAHRYADAVVVPTHSVAEMLDDAVGFGDRLRVIGEGVSARLDVPANSEERAAELHLPDEFILAAGTIEPRRKLDALIQAKAIAGDAIPPLLIAGGPGWGDVDLDALSAAAGLSSQQLRHLGKLADADLAVALHRATVFAIPAVADGSGLYLLDAFRAGTPVVHADSRSLVESAADAGVSAAAGDDDLFPDRLAEALVRVCGDAPLRQRLSQLGRDRASAFSWQDSAQRVWQVHAEL